MNNRYDTLSEATVELKKRGFTNNFEVNADRHLVAESGAVFKPNDTVLCEFHRFEGMSNPSDTSIVYALETKSGLKGILIDAYGVDSSPAISDYIKKVEDEAHNEC